MSRTVRFGDGQVITGLGLILFSVPLLAADLLDPTRGNKGDAAMDIADVASHPEAFLAATVLMTVSTIALLVATAGLWRVARTHTRRLADVGAGLVALGALGHGALVMFNGFLYEMRGGDPAEMVAMLDRAGNGAVLLMVFPMLIALGIGLIILVVALRRSGMAPAWCVVAVSVTLVADFFGGGLPFITYVVYGLVTVTWVWIAVVVLRMPAATWNGAPETSAVSRRPVELAL